MRSIYYHLKKGMQTGEIQIEKVKIEKGEYSWGNEAEKVYYEIGKKAEPKMLDEGVKCFSWTIKGSFFQALRGCRLTVSG